jgi:hypothetical protein
MRGHPGTAVLDVTPEVRLQMARHEAAHAVVAVRLGMLQDVSIRAEGRVLMEDAARGGFVAVGELGETWTSPPWTTRIRHWHEKAAIITAAAFASGVTHGSASDMKMLRVAAPATLQRSERARWAWKRVVMAKRLLWCDGGAAWDAVARALLAARARTRFYEGDRWCRLPARKVKPFVPGQRVRRVA